MKTINLIAEPGKQEIIITRTFDAPRDIVFKLLTDPKQIPNWWGPRNTQTIVDKMELRKGGIWRFINRDDKGNDACFNGVYHDIAAPERVTQTFEFEGIPSGHALLETMTLQEQDGKTLLTTKSVYQSVQDRDGMLQSGMEKGTSDTYDRFEELLAKMK